MWSPRRPVIVMDSSKLDYFARAAMVRAGTMGTYGALSGAPTGIFGAVTVPSFSGPVPVESLPTSCRKSGVGCPPGVDGYAAMQADRELERQSMPSTPGPTQGGTTGAATTSNTATSSGLDTVASWLNKLASAVMPSAQAAPAVAAPAPEPATVLGIPVTGLLIGGAVVVGGLVLFKVMKKK